MIDAIVILENGSWFELKIEHPHETYLVLTWGNFELEFVFFGSYKNRVLYHSTRMKNEC